MTTTTTRATELRDQIAEAARQMGIHPTGSPVWCAALAQHGTAKRELRQMEEQS